MRILKHGKPNTYHLKRSKHISCCFASSIDDCGVSYLTASARFLEARFLSSTNEVWMCLKSRPLQNTLPDPLRKMTLESSFVLVSNTFVSSCKAWENFSVIQFIHQSQSIVLVGSENRNFSNRFYVYI